MGVPTSSESGGVGFNLGAVNLYNYSLEIGPGVFQHGPYINRGATISPYTRLPATSNTYYLAAEDVTGILDYNLTLPEGVSVSVVIK
jgi:hypothetical protein